MALERLTRTDDPELALKLLQRRVTADEQLDDVKSAGRWADEALALARTLRNPASIFASGVVVLRLARQAMRWNDPEVRRLQTELIELSKHETVVHQLAESPSVMREAAAELGQDAPELLIVALERLGFETAGSGIHVERLTDELLKLLQNEGGRIIEASDGTHIQMSRAAVASIGNRIRRGEIGEESLHALAALYATNVERLARLRPS
jgi:hypothetical protein